MSDDDKCDKYDEEEEELEVEEKEEIAAEEVEKEKEEVEEEVCPNCKGKGIMSCEFPSHFSTFNEDGYYCENCYVITITYNNNGYSYKETCLWCLQTLISQGDDCKQDHYVDIRDIHKLTSLNKPTITEKLINVETEKVD